MELDAETAEELLVDWLREILYQNQTRGFVPTRVVMDELTGNHLHARLKGGIPDAGSAPEMEIKAVTYHGLTVEKSDEGYLAKIILDI